MISIAPPTAIMYMYLLPISHIKIKFSVGIAAFSRRDTVGSEVQEKSIRSHRSDNGRTGKNMRIQELVMYYLEQSNLYLFKHTSLVFI